MSADKSAAEEEEQSRVVARPQEDIHDIIREKGVGGWGLCVSGWSLCMEFITVAIYVALQLSNV